MPVVAETAKINQTPLFSIPLYKFKPAGKWTIIH